MHEIRPIFAIPLGVTGIPEHLIPKLVESVYQLKEKPNMDYSHSLAGVIEEGSQVVLPHRYSSGVPAWDSIVKEFTEFITQETQVYLENSYRAHNVDYDQVVTSQKKKLELMDIWATIQRPGDYNPVHVHDGILAGTAFIKVPEYISEQAISPGNTTMDGSLNFIHGNSWGPLEFNLNGTYKISPRVGSMFIFPCWLNHIVYPFKGEQSEDYDRISLAWNFSLS